MLESLRSALPDGLPVYSAEEVPLSRPGGSYAESLTQLMVAYEALVAVAVDGGGLDGDQVGDVPEEGEREALI